MSELPLDRPLPAELLRRLTGGLAAYQLYPVFSWPWLRKRSLLVTLGASSFGVLIALGGWDSQQDLARFWLMPAQFTFGVVALASSGPLLATLVRNRGLRRPLERRFVIAAIALGVLISFAVDSWVSTAIDRSLPPRQVAPEPMAVPGLVLNGLVLITIYGLLGGGLALRRYLGEAHGMALLAKERELAALRAQNHALDQRLSLLQAQIEPHFLFNTLASVRSLIGSDPALAGTTIELLVDYLRATIPRLREMSVDSTLGQQLEICESYLRLMCVRTGRLQYRIEVDPALCARNFPPLLLISLVENAIKHGIEPKVGPGSVTIYARARPGLLEVGVVDDGIGLRDGFGSGLGLRNVRELLLARYGARATFTLSSALVDGVAGVDGVKGVHGATSACGTRASIEIAEESA